MIKYNNSNINDWNYGSDNIVKVYRNNAVCYYQFISSGGTPTQVPCYAVVNDISQYSDTEFVDVFNKADEKWYKLNNLNQYEEYGVYGDSISSGSTSRLPQGYTEVEYIQNNTQGAYINTGLLLYDVTGNSFSISAKLKSQYESTWVGDGYYLQTIINSENVSSPYYGFTFRYAYQTHILEGTSNPSNSVTFSSTANTDGTSSLTINCNSTTVTTQVPLELFASYNRNYNTPYRFSNTTIYSFQVTKNNTLVRDLVPCKRDSDSMVGLYDIVNDVFYYPPNYTSYQLVAGSAVTPTAATYYEGKLAIVDGYEYMYSGSSWINVGEVSGSTATLPDVPFTLNYNARQYDSSTNKIPQTDGQLQNVDAVRNYGSGVVDHSADGYISITSNTRFICSGNNGTYLNRTNTQTGCTMTIVSKAKTTSGYSIFTNRLNNNYRQYMYRQDTSGMYLCGTGATTPLACSNSVPSVISIKVYYNGGVKASATNHTNGNILAEEAYAYNNQSSTNAGALFCDYASYNSEFWQGDFYWIYMSQNVLTDEQIQQVIDYNESSGGTVEYPLYYDEKADPPNNLSFSSMTEAEEYECPWVGMQATIDGVKYIFSGNSTSGYEWVEKPSRLPQGYTEVEYIENTGTSYLDTNFVPNQDTRVVCDMQLVTQTDYPRIWGAGKWNNTNGIQPNYEGGYFQMSWFGKTSWTKYTSLPTNLNRHTYDVNKNYVYVDGTLLGSNTYTTMTASDHMAVFTYINASRPSTTTDWNKEHFRGKLWSFQVYDNGTLVRDLVPCIRDNDSKVGAYDIVNDAFYTVPTGYTTDTLVAGPIV